MGGDDHHGNGGDGGDNGGGSDVDKLVDDYGELLVVFVIQWPRGQGKQYFPMEQLNCALYGDGGSGDGSVVGGGVDV